jgi:outer membrane protein TolC
MPLTRRALLTALLLGALPFAASAQPVVPEALRGGVPTGAPSAEPLELTLDQAIERGLQHNLGLILGQEQIRQAQGAYGEAHSELLPQLRAGASAVRQKISLAAFGFSGFGDFPELIGPFNVVDARGYATLTVLDLHALRHSQSQKLSAQAAEQTQVSTRDAVVLACAGLYFQAVAGESRISAAQARLATAQALFEIASDRKQAGLVAGVDVLRAQVLLAGERQRLIVAEDEAAKQKLALSRAIGLPLGQVFQLADEMPFAPAPPITPEEAVQRAYATRADLKAAESRVQAAQQERKAASGEGLPSLGVSGDYGAIGNTVGGARGTYAVAASLRIPVFEGGRVQAKVQQADAKLRAAEATLADMKGRVYYEVQATLLDLKATAERVGVAQGAVELADQQLVQARDRFSAGVAGNIDVTQAQEALARSQEDRIESLYEHNLSKAALARALGVAETSYREFLGGSRR